MWCAPLIQTGGESRCFRRFYCNRTEQLFFSNWWWLVCLGGSFSAFVWAAVHFSLVAIVRSSGCLAGPADLSHYSGIADSRYSTKSHILAVAMSARKELQKRLSKHWAQVRSKLRQQCREAKITPVRTIHEAIRAGVIPPVNTVTAVKLQSTPVNFNRNPSGSKVRPVDPECLSCGQMRSQVPWRADGSGRYCKSCAAERRKQNRRLAKERQAATQG